MHHKSSLLVVLALLISSCNIDKERKLSESEILELKKSSNDSIMLVLDSVNTVSIFVPPLFDEQAIDPETTHKFFQLAKETKGELKLLVNSALITNEIKYILEKHTHNNSDILFLIDKTGSMMDDIINVKTGLTEIIDAINNYDDVRVAIGLYGDKNSDGKYWYSFKNFETNLQSAKNFIEEIRVTNGGDFPESVYDGFFQSTKENFWKSETKRMVILIGDAPPLEKPLSDYSMSDVIEEATKDKITMNFYPIVVTSAMTVESGKATKVKSYKEIKLISSFYPNPSLGKMNINLEKSDDYEIQIFDSNGAFILKENYFGNKISIELYHIPNGIYIMRIVDSKRNYETIKFVLNK
jgi:Secretion system C-terminal sorting domain/von Willebrand factor type A domain